MLETKRTDSIENVIYKCWTFKKNLTNYKVNEQNVHVNDISRCNALIK